ncbi:MAG: ribonuclease HI family protein [bacterium]|nr:ribonuclease HI family protein [bacterium]
MTRLVIYTDGGARNNPGPAGAGAVIIDGAKKIEIKKFLGNQTNNWAEYEAVALALAEAKKRGFAKRAIEVRLDSQLVAEQLSNHYQIKEETLWPQYMKVHNLLVANFPDAVFNYVPREQNKEADRLVNEAIDEANSPR